MHVTKLMSSMFIIPTDHWISPNVSGDKPPPVQGFTLSKIANEKALLFMVAITPQGRSSELRVATVLGDSVVSMFVHYLMFAIFLIIFILNPLYSARGCIEESNKNVLHDSAIHSTELCQYLLQLCIANNAN